MTTGKNETKTSRLYVTWYRCMTDDRDHAVTDEDFAQGIQQQEGRYNAVCGHRLLISSVLAPPAPPCTRCLAYLKAPQRPTDNRPGKHRYSKPCLWRRLFGSKPAMGIPSPRQSDTDAPVAAGRHALRGQR